jgi:hypothetical protein
MTISIEGELEIDQERGVIYFHSFNSGTTLLRICQLPKPIPDPRWIITNGSVLKTGSMLDITHMYGADWDKDIENHYKNKSKKQSEVSDGNKD